MTPLKNSDFGGICELERLAMDVTAM